MRISSEVRGQLVLRFEVLFPHLNERQRRLLMGQEARLLGHGGLRAVAQAAGVSETTVRAGVFELEAGEDPLPDGRVRRPGGGRKNVEDLDPKVLPALLALVEPDERGDPMSPLRWTTKSLRTLAEELTAQGHPVSAPTVGRLLREQGFSLQANVKTLEGTQHLDRDAQFRYINEQVKQHQADGQPVISVDAKKKEVLGQLPNPGRQWRPVGDPVQVEDHSFFAVGPDAEVAIPYGVYDITANTGWVNVGVDHDTSAFAVASIRRWWQARGTSDYPGASRLLITADAGGSNNCRFRLWKSELADLAAETGLSITVCHFPPGTSKWNRIEHRLFSHITMNWRGRPLTSHEVVVNAIAATRTRTGLRVEAELDTGAYPVGISVSNARMSALPVTAHTSRGSWNYTIRPTVDHLVVAPPPPIGDGQRSRHLEVLADPLLTGMSREDFARLTESLAPAQDAQAAQRFWQQRGGPRRRAPGAGVKPLFTDADRVVITVVYLRQVCSLGVLSELLAVNKTTIGKIVNDTRLLLRERDVAFTQNTVRFTAPAQLLEYTATGSAPTRTQLSHLLSEPSLTGMSRQDLADLTERLSLLQAARVEQRRHRRRGSDRLPGTRGGVFLQKITDAERVLATVLHKRGLCTRQVLADVFEVSESTIGNALNDVRPLLDQVGYTASTAPRRFISANALLDSVRVSAPQETHISSD
ncbi:ISAzo13 family transposase [Streptomyces sp. NPDC002920]